MPPIPPAYDALFEREIAKYSVLREDAARSAARNEEAVAAITRDAQVRLRRPC